MSQLQPGPSYDAYIPGGAHSNSRLRHGKPVVASRASGSRVVDEHGREYLDFIMGNGAVVLGHAAPEVVAAVSDCVARGLTTGVESTFAMEAAESIRSLIPEPGMIRFATTGTEAILHCLDIARAATGRTVFAKAEGAYHGWAAPLNVSTWPSAADWGPLERPHAVPGAAGLAESCLDTLIFPFNNLEAAEGLLLQRGTELAAVLVEPVLIDVGFIPAERDFLLGLRQLTRRIGALLIFDETLTGFRLAKGGARELYGVQPDLTIYGKAIANGYPLAAVEGRSDLMELTNPQKGGKVGFVGTHNGHAVSVAAAVASLKTLSDDITLQRLGALTLELRTGVRDLASSAKVPVTFAGGGGHFQIYFTERPVRDYRSAATSDPALYQSLVAACDRADILYPDTPLGHAALSTSHTTEDLARLLEALQEVTQNPPPGWNMKQDLLPDKAVMDVDWADRGRV
jgi:glutamate-1-semialdehyde 2,1-aminomutase